MLEMEHSVMVIISLIKKMFKKIFRGKFNVNNFQKFFADVCDKYCENEGVCVKDIKGQPSCRCIGSFTGKHCSEKSEFAYIAGGIAGGVIFIILIILLVWMICARLVYRMAKFKMARI